MNTHNKNKYLYALVRSIARLLLKSGVDIAAAVEMMKMAYVETAIDAQAENLEPSQLKKREPTTNATRIATFTGLNRKEVGRILKARKPDWHDELMDAATPIYSLTCKWLNDSRYCIAPGVPRALKKTGDIPSFEELCSEFFPAEPWKKVFRHLLDMGMIQQSDNEYLTLSTLFFYPSNNLDEKIWVISTSINDLVSTCTHNIDIAGDDSRYQSFVAYNNVPTEVLPMIKSRAEHKSHELLVSINEWLSAFDRDVNPIVTGSDNNRVGVGVYYFEIPGGKGE